MAIEKSNLHRDPGVRRGNFPTGPLERPLATGLLSRALALLLAAGAASAAHADNTAIDLGVTAGYESNAPRAERASDRASDVTQAARLRIARSAMLDAHSGVTLSATLAYENHQRFSALNNGTAKLEAVYIIQPVAGHSTPWYEAAISVEALKFADSRIRDGVIGAASLAVGKNLTDRLQAKAGGSYEKRWASYENVYDLKWRKAFADISYQLQKNTVFARVTRLWGDQVFSVRPGAELTSAKASEDDPAFGAAYEAYRLGATTNTFDLGLVVPVAERDSIIGSASSYLTRAEGGHRYDDSVIRITWSHRF